MVVIYCKKYKNEKRYFISHKKLIYIVNKYDNKFDDLYIIGGVVKNEFDSWDFVKNINSYKCNNFHLNILQLLQSNDNLNIKLAFEIIDMKYANKFRD